MPDMEKVIKGLELLKDFLCDGLPGKRVVFNSYIGIANDAIAMLKEQEASNTGKARIFQCEKCGYGFDDIFLTDEHNYDIEPNYCPNCGRLVKLNV